MTHLFVMSVFAVLVAVCFGVVGREDSRGKALYGLKVFAEFLAIGLALAWLLYSIPG